MAFDCGLRGLPRPRLGSGCQERTLFILSFVSCEQWRACGPTGGALSSVQGALAEQTRVWGGWVPAPLGGTLVLGGSPSRLSLVPTCSSGAEPAPVAEAEVHSLSV